MKHFIRAIAIAFVAGMLLTSAPQLFAVAHDISSKPLEPVTMQLRWLHQFQFAGYYAALHKGYYREKGLDVTIVAGAPDRHPVEEVMAGRAQYGEANSELLFHYLKGDPLVALAAIFQHSPSVLLTRKDSGIRTPQDLIGKRIMMVGGTEDVDFLAMLANEGVVSHKFEILPSSYDIQDLINGKTDAFNAYLTNEPYSMREQQIEGYAIQPINYGVDFYSDILFTTQDEIRKHPERVKAFREASLRGWEYAMQHKQEVIDIIEKHYRPDKSRAHLEFEAAAMEALIQPTLIPIGNINPGRFQRMADTLEQFKLVEPGYKLDDFIYDPNPKVALSTFWQTIGFGAVLFLLAGLIALTLWRLNQRLGREIVHSREAELMLKQSEQHFRSIIENLQDVYYRADTHGALLEVSPSVESIFGYTPAEINGTQMADYYAPPFSRDDLLNALKVSGGVLHGYEIKIYNKQGETRWVSVNTHYTFAPDGVVTGVEGTIRDITEARTYQDKIARMAMMDPLTGLPNRRSLLDMLHHCIATNQRRGQLGALLYVDLDEFKPVNDNYGHNVGDRLLVEAARRMQKLLRAEDSVSRIGGDEFIVLLPCLSLARAEAEAESRLVGEKICAVLSAPFEVAGKQLHISASIGVALFPDQDLDSDELIVKADSAMYKAKHRGRNQVAVA
ncbi:MAG: ABC transporter substrate-binding protein [Sulfurimicrobium sp.]|jgi:diguanylate cyclase (GGDEF)-like protein/PAS domain S-box-containing protein|nr:ABC transporter substrate-binding protein [Sulfurimicrobium sp.]MDZ7655948.1 ABC transporter substrate-binding protein [Sulfurimicrobium sp.]